MKSREFSESSETSVSGNKNACKYLTSTRRHFGFVLTLYWLPRPIEAGSGAVLGQWESVRLAEGTGTGHCNYGAVSSTPMRVAKPLSARMGVLLTAP